MAKACESPHAFSSEHVHPPRPEQSSSLGALRVLSRQNSVFIGILQLSHITHFSRDIYIKIFCCNLHITGEERAVKAPHSSKKGIRVRAKINTNSGNSLTQFLVSFSMFFIFLRGDRVQSLNFSSPAVSAQKENSGSRH